MTGSVGCLQFTRVQSVKMMGKCSKQHKILINTANIGSCSQSCRPLKYRLHLHHFNVGFRDEAVDSILYLGHRSFLLAIEQHCFARTHHSLAACRVPTTLWGKMAVGLYTGVHATQTLVHLTARVTLSHKVVWTLCYTPRRNPINTQNFHLQLNRRDGRICI